MCQELFFKLYICYLILEQSFEEGITIFSI